MNLDICIYGESGHATPWLNAFHSGLLRHGITARRELNSFSEADLVVIWSHHKKDIIEKQKNRDRDYLVMERGYFGDRFKYCSCGFNGLNGRAKFYNDNSPGDRWRSFQNLLKPWKKEGDYILVMGQVASDAAVKNIDISQWYKEICELLDKISDRPIKLRPHPLAPKASKYPQEIELSNNDLKTDLDNAHIVITYNSNSGVDAVLAGVPTISMDKGSMAWPVTFHEINFYRIQRPFITSRKQWAYDLAYCQWSMDEIKSGKTWDHLKQRYSKK